jgi:hypothetical protein
MVAAPFRRPNMLSDALSVLNEVPMRSTCQLVAYATLALATVGCGRSIEVRTMVAPDAGLSTLHTFRMLPGPARRDGHAATGADDPMINNSIANRAIRAPMNAIPTSVWRSTPARARSST